MREVAEELKRWRARGDANVALATLVSAQGSAPRPLGSKLAVSEQGELAGSVSGGCVENEVYEEATAVLASGAPKLLSYGISDEQAWSAGLPCGGEIEVFVERPEWGELERIFAAIDSGERVTRTTVLDESGRLFVEELGPPARLIVYGAVDTAEFLCRAAKELGWRTVVADARSRFATRDRIPSADELYVEWPDQVFEREPPDAATAVVVLSHEDRFDIPALTGALRSDAFYVGALGSRRNQERRRERLLEAGLGEDDLERISGPTGLDIGAESPAETALSILGEILAVRSGRTGGRLRETRGRIHAAAALR